MGLFGFESVSDMFDGGGAGGSGASFSTGSHADYVTNNPNDTTAKAHDSGGSFVGNTVSDVVGSVTGGGSTTATIKSGQTLSGIAAANGLTVAQLMAANPNITDANKIQSGASINIPSSGGGSIANVKGSAPSGINKVLGFASPVGVIGALAGWANGLDPETQEKGVYDGKQVYQNAEGMQYSYNFLGMPYQVEVNESTGKVQDFLRKDESGKYPGDEGYDQSSSGYEKMAQESRDNGDDDQAAAIMQEAADNATEDDGSNATTSGAATIIKMAQEAGMAVSNEQIQEILDDPAEWLKTNGASLIDKTPTLDPDTAGTLLDPTSPNYLLGKNPSVTVSTAGDASSVGSVINPATATYDASTTADQLGTDATTVNAATGEIRDENLVDAAQIDMTGAATGVNADGTTSVTGEALNDFATQNISNIIDTTTVSGKLLAQKLGEGNYTDAKATVLGQMKIISDEFKDSNGNPVIPPWAQKLARETQKTLAFSGITGTAQTAAMANAIMEATLGIAEKEAVFFQTLTTKNLDNRQEAIINKAAVLAKFEVANLDARQAAAVQNAKAFLEMDLKNLTNEQQAEVVNTQAMVDALFNDQAAINAARLFGAEQANDMQKYYDNMNAQISLQNAEQINQMKRFNTGEINDNREFNSKLEQSRQEFYADMQYNLDLANAKWRQTVATTNTEMEFEAATLDVKNAFDLSTESMTRMWDRVDNLLDYIFKGWNAEADRDATILAAEIRAQAGQSSGGNGIMDGLVTLGAAWISSGRGWPSDERLKTDIQYLNTEKGLKIYSWKWNKEAKRIGANKFPAYGVIAQQVQKKYPNAVSVGSHGYLTVNYGEIQ